MGCGGILKSKNVRVARSRSIGGSIVSLYILDTVIEFYDWFLISFVN